MRWLGGHDVRNCRIGRMLPLPVGKGGRGGEGKILAAIPFLALTRAYPNP